MYFVMLFSSQFICFQLYLIIYCQLCCVQLNASVLNLFDFIFGCVHLTGFLFRFFFYHLLSSSYIPLNELRFESLTLIY